MGSIEVGKLADMVLLTADPSVDIDNAKEIDTVILGGAIVDRSSLDLPSPPAATGTSGCRPRRLRWRSRSCCLRSSAPG